ncbi:protein O-mannosyl-transferase 1-like [Octopus sinensis]|uniref:dolichyl-phosphate-mannose--protein mannosyltransferase n=1 Tax=Octopus sinensis TaxID=2607531 RepID=A0A7E6FMD4_9MOLL|nr:protein O-mannosyl-transferase 1-like [Octopus sinensis]
MSATVEGNTERYEQLQNIKAKSCALPKERDQGDGAPEGKSTKKEQKPFSVKLELDLVQIFLFIGAWATRTWQIGLPRAVVFDELHFAKFVSLYLQNIFFFDIHPPLGKLLLTLAGHYTGFQGNLSFDRIGTEYPSTVPVSQLRLLPAILGSLLVPLVYQIVVELHLSRWAALLAASFVLFDNAILVQSRFILMEGMLLFFIALALLCFLKFHHMPEQEFNLQWWLWLTITGLSLTCAFSIKYIGLMTFILVLLSIFKDYWSMLADILKSDLCLVQHFCARFMCLFIIPAFLYIGIFFIHLSILTKAGPHDNVMTSAFQASLEGGLAALTKGQPLNVAYGSQITLRYNNNPSPGRPCWLHSHPHVYPIRYVDGRGSSHQQQVTCYIFKDLYNWWIIKHPNSNTLMVNDPPQPVKHGDLIQLVHGLTGRALNSHDVAAPMSPQNQEVSCYIDYNVSMPSQNLWRVELVNRDSDQDNWQTINSLVRLHHVNTSQALKVSGKQLPEWGFHQLEVVTDRIAEQDPTIWNVEEHRYTKASGKEGQTRELSEAEMIPSEPTQLSLWAKFWELQVKMISSNHDVDLEHKYSSGPLEWPLMDKNVAYWISPNTNAQIHLLGNIFIWYLCTASLFGYLTLWIFYMLRRRRSLFDLNEVEWDQFTFTGQLLIGGFLFHYLPHFVTDRTLFLHHYLPAFLFQVITCAALFDHFILISARFVPYLSSFVKYLIVLLVLIALGVFLYFSAFSYGNIPLTAADIQQMSWKDSWDFLVRVKLR